MIFKLAFIAVLATVFCIDASDLEIATEFGNFVRDYGKQYLTLEETIKRYRIFANNYEYILKHNAKDSSYKLGINDFADLTLEEFKEMYLHYTPMSDPPNPCTIPHVTGDAKSEINWQHVIPAVKNQGSCGSCWAFSTIGAIEGLYAIKNKKGVVEFSEQELVDCSKTVNMGCQGGYMEYAFGYIMEKGISKASEYPYEARDGRCRKVSESYKIKGCVSVENANNDQLLEALNLGPVSVAVKANSIEFMFYKSGIFDAYTARKNELDHGIVLVGASSQNGNPYWIVRNSWGISWGRRGYGYIKRDIGKGPSICGIAEQNSYPISY